MNRISLALLAILLTAATALAQLNPVSSSIDLSVAQASRVVIGRIAEMGKASGSADHGNRRQPIVLAVDETLKGEPVSRLPLVIGDDCRPCATPTHRLLITVAPMQNHPTSITDLDSDSAFNVSADLRILPTASAILQAARDEVRRCPGVLDEKKYFAWQPTETLLSGTPFHGNTIYVPVDERQESLAHRILETEHAPEAVAHYGENGRANAVLALEFFRSPENIQLLKSLLADRQIEHDVMGQLSYPVRAAAWQVLSKWGVDLPKPVTQVKIQEPWNGLRPD